MAEQWRPFISTHQIDLRAGTQYLATEIKARVQVIRLVNWYTKLVERRSTHDGADVSGTVSQVLNAGRVGTVRNCPSDIMFFG